VTPTFGPAQRYQGTESTLPLAPSRVAARESIAEAPAVVHRLVTICGQLHTPNGVGQRPKAPRVQRNAPPFAGGHGRRPSALGRRARKRAVFGAASGSAKASQAGGLVVGARPARAPDEIGQSSCSLHESTTRGVRANQVGAKLSPRAIAARGAGEASAILGPWPEKPRLGLRRLARDLRTMREPGRDLTRTVTARVTARQHPGIGRFAARARGSHLIAEIDERSLAHAETHRV
jgi:hypothetical protein